MVDQERKIEEMLFSSDAAERKLGFTLMQQLGFLKARELLVRMRHKRKDSIQYGVLYAPLLIAFEVPKYLSYGQHRLLGYHRFERIKTESRCPPRTKAILTYGSYDQSFLNIIFANMHHYGQDVTVANEKGWLLTPDASEDSWYYKASPRFKLPRTGQKHLLWV